jgi:hypothetical protein
MEELLETVFSTRSMQRGYQQDEFYLVVRQWPAGNGVSAKAEKSRLLDAVTRKRLVKILQAGKDLACALVICEAWRSAMVL